MPLGRIRGQLFDVLSLGEISCLRRQTDPSSQLKILRRPVVLETLMSQATRSSRHRNAGQQLTAKGSKP